MRAPFHVYEALARALAPPRGEARAFKDLGLPAPDPEALGDEHAALFGRAGRAALAPYEGVHRGTPLHEVLAAFARFGFAPDPSFRDRPDHVCLQLALAARLSRGAGDAPAPEEARQFFHLRLWPWVPAWFDKLTSLREFPAHRALALVAAGFLDEEGTRMGAPRNGRQSPANGTLAQPRCTEPRCKECGEPVGFAPPRGEPSMPAHARICARCRFRIDLRRLGS